MFIEIKDAVKTYGRDEARVYALNKASLGIDKGKIAVILGPSGSGKSTLLNVIGGLDTPESGNVLIEGNDIAKYGKENLTKYRRDNVGFVFQFYNLIRDLSVKENIQVVSDIVKNPLDIDEVLDALDLQNLCYRFPSELSGGQQQRVAIARAMIKNPKLLLCDELTGALDTESSRNVLMFVEKMNRQYHTTVAIITHNEAIREMADIIIRLKDGKITETIYNTNKASAKDLQL